MTAQIIAFQKAPSAYAQKFNEVYVAEINKALIIRPPLTRAQRSAINREAHAKAHAAAKEMTMADLAGRGVQSKAAFKAEQDALKAGRKGTTGKATKKRFEKTAERVTAPVVSDATIDELVEQASARGADPDKVRAYCEDLRRRLPDASIRRFTEMLNEDRDKLA
jgi:hypothetical protein